MLRKDSFQNPSEPFFEGKIQDFFERIQKILYKVFRLLSQKKRKTCPKLKRLERNEEICLRILKQHSIYLFFKQLIIYF